MRILKALLVVAMFAAPSFAQNVFEVGDAGFVIPGNNWPGGENPTFAIDGFGQKYLNFGQENTGFVVTPSVGSTIATSLQLWAANDAIERDPASYQVWGTNADAPAGFGAPGDTLPLSAFTPISVGDLMLPDTRNAGGDAALEDANSQTVTFSNTDAYTSYLVVFPTVKNIDAANSMQIAEVQLFDAAGGIFSPGDPIVGGQVVPEPSSSLLGAMSLLSIMLFVRKRRNK